MGEALPPMCEKVKCPHCSYVMPLLYTKDAESKGIYVRCKGKHCKKMFEIKIPKTK